MSLKETIEKYLEEEPHFRERKNKDRGMVNLLMRRYPGLDKAVKEGLIGKDTVTAIFQDYASMDRYWRQTLGRNPHLRGTDYDDKDVYEHKKVTELGYATPPLQP